MCYYKKSVQKDLYIIPAQSLGKSLCAEPEKILSASILCIDSLQYLGAECFDSGGGHESFRKS